MGAEEIGEQRRSASRPEDGGSGVLADATWVGHAAHPILRAACCLACHADTYRLATSALLIAWYEWPPCQTHLYRTETITKRLTDKRLTRNLLLLLLLLFTHS